jgi:hypothetical protein
MKIPKTNTIRSKFVGYAYKAGFTVHPHDGGTFNLFSIRANEYTHRNIDKDYLVKVVVDELHRINNRKHSLRVGV